MLLILLLFLASGFFVLRSLLVIFGLLKGPILQTFEKYGDAEGLAFPVLHFLVALPFFLLTFTYLLFGGSVPVGLSSPYLAYCLMIGLTAVMYFSYHYLKDLAQRYPQVFMAYPRWYNALRERTTRAERRRIAYMWLCLPWRTRLFYNSSDDAFTIWVDLVLLACIRPENDLDVDVKSRMWQ